MISAKPCWKRASMSPATSSPRLGTEWKRKTWLTFLVDPGMFGKIDLPPVFRHPEFLDSFSYENVDVACHQEKSIDNQETLNSISL
jgi:hypothetical protein